MTPTQAAVILALAPIAFVLSAAAFVVWLLWPVLDDDTTDVEADDD